ncbi:germination protein, GerC family [Paenibacillus mucilaginosus 3016]|uniref:Germination protein, GerC family n=2 Tax=Paenibacillus mucilaginosus TaxID=61624 RepID=H6N973_9BACL|nr:Ger(x)C family spore germination protein [Paenibacillus mucilaginosus]AFC27819.1 germination protein, GerC family [Paenibacillus mucilaginosus 3016]AFH59972.1 germination protein Ger(x)C [Paenibacillus mucilaginosus K02]WFA16687.1 Ger(x)C family spore germination protein [Paenibacillus mucilaginosus]
MIRLLLRSALCLLLVLGSAGCWNRRELNDIAIAVGLAIDWDPSGQYVITAQIVDPGEVAPRKGGGTATTVSTYEARNQSVSEALRKMTTVLPRKIYLSHLQILVLGEALADRGIAESLEFLSRNHEVRSDFFVVLSKGAKAGDILNVLTPLEKIPSQKLRKSLETSEKIWAPTHTVQLDELITDMVEPGRSAVLTGVKIEGSKSKGKTREGLSSITPSGMLEYANLAVMRKDRLAGWLNEQESKGYNYIKGDVKNTVGTIGCGGSGTVSLEVYNSKSSIKAIIRDGAPSILVSLTTESNVTEVNCDVDLSKQEAVEMLEQEAVKRTKEVVNSSIQKAKKLKSDIFGFGEMIHQKDPKAWAVLKEDWDAHFVKLPVTVEVEAHIRRTGTTNKSYLGQMKGGG